MNAVALLKKDHQQINSIFNQLESEQLIEKRKEIFNNVRQEIEMHAYIEEKVFYPFFADKKGFQDQIEEAYDEHQEVKSLLIEIQNEKDENEFDNLVGEMVKAFRNHVKEEEEDLFPKVEKVLNGTQLETMGRKMEESKHDRPQESPVAA